MKKTLLTERFQQLAGIKPLYENLEEIGMFHDPLGYQPDTEDNESPSTTDEDLDKLLDIILKYVEDPDDAEAELDRFDQGGFDAMSDYVTANLDRDPEYKAWYDKLHGEANQSYKKGSLMIGLKVVSRDEMSSYMYSNPNKPIDQGSDGGKWYQTNSVPETDRLVTWDTIKDDMIALEKKYGEGNVVVSGTTRGGDPVVDVYINSIS
jgi:hypothetical protein